MHSTALDGLRVIDLSRNLAGAYCTQMLTGFGADVTLIEPPDGHPLRHRGPFVDGQPHVEKSIPFLWFGQGKHSIIADLNSEQDRERVRRLVAGADVVVESFQPGERKGTGFEYEELLTLNSRLVDVSITPFGLSGPYRDYRAEEITIEALSGQMYGTGSPDHPPLCSGPPIAEMTAGLHGYIGALTALRVRAADGRSRQVEVSILEAGVDNMELRAFGYWHSGKDPTRPEMAVPAVVPWKSYRCRDGWAAILGAPFRRWRYFARLLRGGRLLEFLYAKGIRKLERSDHVQAGSLGGKRRDRLKRWFQRHVDARVAKWAAGKTKDEILAVARRDQLAFGALRSLDEILELPQHEARGFFHTVEHTVAGAHRYCGAPFPMSRTPWQSKPAPLLGAHNDKVDAEPIGRTPAQQSHVPLPLAGVRIVDLTCVEVAPHGTRILADFGAEVIKVEYPQRLDLFRGTAMRDRAYDRQPFWGQLNRNKRSVALDLKSDVGLKAFGKLVAVSDVVVVNFRCGVIERLGIDYDALRAIRPDVIFVSMPGYGDGGPDSDLPAFGGVIEVMSGVQNLTGHRGVEKTERIREIDILNGVVGTAAVLTALAHRERTGEGQSVELSQMEATTHALMGDALLETAATGNTRRPTGNRSPCHAPQGCYRCRDADAWVAVSIRTNDEFHALSDVIGQPDWKTDPKLDSSEGRREHHDALDEDISAWPPRHEHREAMQLLQDAGVAAGAVLSLQQVVDDPHMCQRAWFQGSREQPESFFMGYPFAISGIAPSPPQRGPALGEANAEIFGDLLGLPQAERPQLNRDEIRSAFHLDPYEPRPRS